MLRFTVSLKAKAGACALQMYPKTLKIRFSGKMTPFPKNLKILFREEFMSTPIHVLCSNFTDIVRLEVSETMRCFDDKKFAFKCRFFAAIMCPFGWYYGKLFSHLILTYRQ